MSNRRTKMEHVLFIQKVKPEKKEEYIRAHKEVWPDLLKLIHESGVQRELIWIQDDTLYIYIMVEDFDKAISYQSKSKVFQDWLKEMSSFLAEMQDYSDEGGVVRLEKVFDLEEQLGKLSGS
jgi:L-rhamnose mutarotase